MTARPPLTPGERAPDFVLPRPDGGQARFYAVAGGAPTVLRFVDAAEPDAVPAGVADWRVVRAAQDAGLGDGGVFLDPEGRVGDAYGAGPEAAVFVLDPALRVLAALPAGPEVAARVEAVLAELAPGPEGTVTVQAPVLLVPRALPAGTCGDLVALWETGGHAETGVERSAGEGRGDALVAEAKRRRDHVVTDPDRMRALTRAVGRRVLPEVRHAFAFAADRFEGFKIACYDAERGGHFTAHRDNLSPTTAHRRFALSLNLNDTYDGGELRFPEYSAQRYRPPAGGALLFSCSLLHEVLPVTRGQRFVLLSFLFTGERAAGRQAVPSRA